MEFSQACESSQRLRYVSGKAVIVKIQFLQVFKIAQPCRDSPAQLVPVQVECFEPDKPAQFRRDFAGQSDITQIVSQPGAVKRETPKVFKVAQLRRDFAGEPVSAQGKDRQVLELAQLRRDPARQPAVGDIQPLQAGEPAQLRRDSPFKLVFAQGQDLQVFKLPQC